MAGQIKRSLVSFSAVALAMAVSSSAYGVDLTENFDTDPAPRGWSGVNNTTSPNNYGYSATTNNAGGSLGEGGGFVNRGPNSFWGVDLGGAFDPNTTSMHASGIMQNPQRGSSTTLNFGWSQGIASANGNGGEPGAMLGIAFDDGLVGNVMARGNGFGIDNTGWAGPNRDETSVPTTFDFTWDHTTGTLTVAIGANSASLTIGGGDLNDVPDLTHWGMWGRTDSSPDNGNTIWIDDVSYSAISEIVPPIPEPASLGLLSLGGLMALRRRRA